MDVGKKHLCEICNQKFTRLCNLKTHIKVKHQLTSLKFSCYLCKQNFKKQTDYLEHIDNHKEGIKFVLYKDVFDGTMQVFHKHFIDCFSIYNILSEVDDITKLLQSKLTQYPKFKINFLVVAEYVLKGNDNIVSEKELFNLRSSNFIISRINSGKSLTKIIIKHLSEIIHKEKELNLPGSGWTSNNIVFIDISLYKLNLLL